MVKLLEIKHLYDYEIYRTLTKAEQTWIQKNYEIINGKFYRST